MLLTRRRPRVEPVLYCVQKFSNTTSVGKNLKINQVRGRVTLLSFFFSCTPGNCYSFPFTYRACTCTCASTYYVCANKRENSALIFTYYQLSTCKFHEALLLLSCTLDCSNAILCQNDMNTCINKINMEQKDWYWSKFCIAGNSKSGEPILGMSGFQRGWCVFVKFNPGFGVSEAAYESNKQDNLCRKLSKD